MFEFAVCLEDGIGVDRDLPDDFFDESATGRPTRRRPRRRRRLWTCCTICWYGETPGIAIQSELDHDGHTFTRRLRENKKYYHIGDIWEVGHPEGRP